MIICSRCGKENQDHYKFCLGCGTELTAPSPRPSRAPAPADDDISARVAVGPTPPAGVASADVSGARGPIPPTVMPASSAAIPLEKPKPKPSVSPPASTTPPGDAKPQPGKPAADDAGPSCPSCGTPNPPAFTFCGNCGARLKQAAEGPSTALRVAKSAPAPQAGPLARLALIRPDGSEGGSFDVVEPETTLGRGSGALFDNDAYLSPQHVRMVFDAHGVLIEDLGSLNGVYVRIVEPEPLNPGDVLRIGQELLRYDPITDPAPLDDGTEVLGSPNPGYWGRLSLIVSRTSDGSAFPLMGDEMDLGRERGDILFSDDGYVSGRHAKIYLADEGVYLTDLGSSNGTFIRLGEPRQVPYGTYLLIGQQLFRLEKA